MDYEDEEFYDTDYRDFSETIDRLWEKLSRYEKLKIRKKINILYYLIQKVMKNIKFYLQFILLKISSYKFMTLPNRNL